MSAPNPVTTILPNGDSIYLQMPYTAAQTQGVTVLVIISCFSLVAVVGLLATIALSAFNTRSSLDQHLFVRTHVAAYFISLLLCDLMQAVGSILNAEWIQNSAVSVGTICQIQGILKQASDVGTALWTLIIALHTFLLLVLEWKAGRVVLWTTLIGVWSIIGTVVLIGPAALDTNKRGPFFSISGYWCWISTTFPGARITLDYMFMFMAALLSFILYSLMYLRLRGNLKFSGHRFRFQMKGGSPDTGITGDQALKIAKQMLLYPLAYTLLILPIAASRFSAWSGHEVPFEITIFSAAVFLCSGVVNVTLFATTRRILPPDSLRIHISKVSISKPTVISMPARLEEGAHDPYYGEARMVDVDLSDDYSEKGSYHTRSTSSSSKQSSLSQDMPYPSLQYDGEKRMSMDGYDGYNGHAEYPRDLPHDVRESVQSADFRQSLQLPQSPPAAASRYDSRKSAMESIYNLYTDRQSTISSYYQYSSGQNYEPFPEELGKRVHDETK